METITIPTLDDTENFMSNERSFGNTHHRGHDRGHHWDHDWRQKILDIVERSTSLDGDVVEDAPETPSLTDSTETSGQIAFRRQHWSDFTASFTSLQSAQLGVFSVGAIDEQSNGRHHWHHGHHNGHGSGLNTLDWSYSLDNAAVQYLAEGETVTENYKVTIQDENGHSVDQIVSITITGTNDAPTAEAISGGANEAGPAIILAANFMDVDVTDTHTFAVDTTGTLGSVTNNGDGTFSYDPNGQFNSLAAGETATDTFTYTVDDGNGGLATATATVTILGVGGENNPPVVEAILGTADENGPAIIMTAAFTDADASDTHSFTVDTTGTLGSVVNNADGTFGYDPNGQFEALAVGETATDTFTYTVDDGNGGMVTQTATVTINGANDAPTAEAILGTADENGPAIVLAGIFADIDASDVHSFTVDTTGTLGSVVNNADGTFGYDPNGQFEALAVGETATDTFTYTVDDGNGGMVTQTATVTINGANDAPTAEAILGTADENGPAIVLTGLFADIDTSDTHSFTVDTTGTLGSVVNNADGTFGYDPNGQFESLAVGETATDTFSYTVDDGNGGMVSQTATVTINGANDAPTAEAILGTADENGPAIVLAGLFADIDASDVHSFTVDTTGTLGSVVNNADGTFGYDPSGQFESLAVGETATDTFSYTVDDGNGGMVSQTATVTINGANDAPTAEAILGTADENGPAIVLAGIFADIDTTDTHSFTVDTTGTLGSVVNNADGTFGYDPNGQFESLAVGETATDTFTYTVDDGNGGVVTQTATVTINGANDAPTAEAILGTADENGPAIIMTAAFTDADASDVHSFTVDTTGTLGSVVNNADGTFGYDPNGQFESLAVGETATDTFTYTVDDGNGGMVTQTATITINGANDAPTAEAILGTADENGPAIVLAGLFADIDASDTHSFTVDTTGTLGSVVNNADGTFGYDPNGQFESLAVGETATDTFTYTVDDGNGGMVTQTATVTINGANDAPTAEAILGTADENGPAIVLAGIFADIDTTDTHSFTVDTTGTLGSVVNNADGTFGYDPNGQFETLAVGETATDTFTYTVDDGNGGVVTQTATVTINGANDAPTAEAILGTADENGPAIVLTALFADIDASDVHSFTVDTTGTLGSVVNNADGTFGYDPNGQFETLAVGETATDTFTYTVDDGNGGMVTQTATVTINGANDAPTAEAILGTADENGPAIVLAGIFADIDASDVHSFTVDTTGTLGSVVNNADGTFGYDPNGQFETLAVGETATDTFTYTVDDGNGGMVTQTATVTINGADAIIG